MKLAETRKHEASAIQILVKNTEDNIKLLHGLV